MVTRYERIKKMYFKGYSKIELPMKRNVDAIIDAIYAYSSDDYKFDIHIQTHSNTIVLENDFITHKLSVYYDSTSLYINGKERIFDKIEIGLAFWFGMIETKKLIAELV